MTSDTRIVILPGDHIGKEVTHAAVRVLEVVEGLRAQRHKIKFDLVYGLVGGGAIDAYGKTCNRD